MTAVSLLRLRTAQLVSAVTISYPRLAVPASELCITANTIRVSLKHGFIILQHGLNKSNRPPQPLIHPQLFSGQEEPVHTSLVDSILVAGQTFHVNLTPSRSSFWLMKSDQVDITDHWCSETVETFTIVEWLKLLLRDLHMRSHLRCALIRYVTSP